ncbi:glycoside hydrolase family 2 [bacterium]|nr:glycoside hydrolase family 2 [bacterium]
MTCEHTRLLESGWSVRCSAEVEESDSEVSGGGCSSLGWYQTSVPSTVLAALVRNGVYRNLYFGRNLEKVPAEPFLHPWWYRTEFLLNEDESSGNVRLVFEGINYSADIWVNGQKAGSCESFFGPFRIHELDITNYIAAGKNILAVKVYPPRPGDFTIGFVDWNPKPPDQNLGLWREVKLRLTGAVSLRDVFVRSKVNLETLDKAALTVSADLINHSDRPVSGAVRGEIENIRLDMPFSLEPRQRLRLVFSPDQYPQLNLTNPRLWWPNNLGEPNLYELRLNALADGEISDEQRVVFGIREVSDYLSEEGCRGYRINGKKVLIRGAGWTDDMLLAEDPDKVEAQVRYARHMNLNTIRLEGFWGSSQRLYDLADRYGIMLMAGWSCQWEWAFLYGGAMDEFEGVSSPEDIALISRSLKDQVTWLRNHPSILVWVYGSDKLPRPELETKYRDMLACVDPTRPSLAACRAAVSEITGPTGVKMAGPYDYVTPNYWYLDRNNGGAFGFNTETGPGPQPPPLESLRRMLPEDHLWPIDSLWEYHCGRGQFNNLDRYRNALDRRYGPAGSVEEFVRKAQVASYEAIRAMFEAFSVNKFNSTGVIQWMLNSAWPEMYWQLYDYYLMPNGAFYGTRAGSQPLNIIYDYGDHGIYLSNDTYSAFKDLRAEIRVLNMQSKVVFAKDLHVGLEENTSRKIFQLPAGDALAPVYFVDLKLFEASGKKLGANFYWLSTREDVLDESGTLWFVTPNKSYADFTALNALPPVEIDAEYLFVERGKEWEMQVTLNNPTEVIAFFIELDVYGKKSGNTVLPVFWDDNYVSLLPGEVKAVRARFPMDGLNGEKPAFRYRGWNVNAGQGKGK